MIKAIVLRQHGVRNGGGAALANALGIPHSSSLTNRRTRHERYVINWGRTDSPNWRQRGISFSNSQEAVSNCVNKYKTLCKLSQQQVPTLEFASYISDNDPESVAGSWCDEDGKVVARHILDGHSGAGIEILRKDGEWKFAKLYTRYFKKNAEYRVHVAFGKVIHVQQKKRSREADRNDNPDSNLVRTNGNGWTFCITNLDCDARDYRSTLEVLALDAAKAVSVNHAAVDILTRHERDGTTTSVVCELNSAPALRNPSTLAPWVAAFRAKFRELGIRTSGDAA